MPSKKTKPAKVRTLSPVSGAYAAFWPLVVLCWVVWVVYRSVFHFDVWFDEVIGKALFFGFPVWLYVSLTRHQSVVNTLAPNKLYSGLWLGLAVGGVYGFVTSILGLLMSSGQVQAALLFVAPNFWWEFFLALMTAFWETLFFFSLVMVVIQEKYKHWSLFKQILTVAAVFVMFHIPNTLLRFTGQQVLVQLFLLALFAIGQALLFVNRRNSFALILSHAIWGMVLLIHLT